MARLLITFVALAIIGGAVSYLGNQLGRYIGRRKMSVFNLRPRHTSILITTITGSFIAVMTLLFAYTSSWEVRTLFMGLEKFQELVSMKIVKAIEQQQTGGVLYRPEEPFFTAVVDGTRTPEEIEAQLMDVIFLANEVAIKRSKDVAEIMGASFEVPSDGKILGYHRDEITALIQTINKIKGRVIVEPISDSYAFLGEKFYVRLKIFEYIPKVFAENEIITSGLIDGSKGRIEVTTEVTKLLVQAKITALRKRMLENPITYQLIEIDRRELTEAVDKILASKKLCTVHVRAKKDTDNRGPLDVFLSIEK